MVIVLAGLTIKRFNNGLKIGDLQIKTSDLKVTWSLNLKTGGLELIGKNIHISIRKMQLSINPFAPINFKSPLIISEVDTIYIRPEKAGGEKRTDNDTRTPGRLEIPVVKIPVTFSANVKSIIYLDSVSAPLLVLEEVTVLNRNFKDLSFSAAKASFLPYPSIQPEISFMYSLEKGQNPHIFALVRYNLDSLSLSMYQDRKNQQNASGILKIKVDNAAGYMAGNRIEELIGAHDINLTAGFNLDTVPDISGSLNLTTKDISVLKSQPINISSHRIILKFFSNKKNVSLSINGSGKNHENFFLTAKSPPVYNDNKLMTVNQIKQLKVDVGGYLNNYLWNLAGRDFPLDVDIQNARLDTSGISARFYTVAGSFVDGNFSWLNGLSAQFTADFAPGEPWAGLWTDRHVVFESFRMNGVFKNKKLTADSRIYKISAYGAESDSIIAVSSVTKDGYYLDSADFFYNNISWQISGNVVWEKNEKGLFFAADNPNFGRAFFSMPDFKYLKASCSGVMVRQVPYPVLEKLFAFEPEVTGVFNWDIKKKSGNADLMAVSSVNGRRIRSALECMWDPEDLTIHKLLLTNNNESVSASGIYQLKGKHFYDVYKIPISDIFNTEVKFKNFNIERWAGIFKDSLLKSAELNGDLSYNSHTGFSGQCHISKLSFFQTDSLMKISDINIMGSGERVHIKTGISSEKYLLLNDSIYISVIDVLNKNPQFKISLTADNNLQVNLSGRLEDEGYLSAALSAKGGLILFSEENGRLENIDLTGDLIVPVSGRKQKFFSFKGNIIHAELSRMDMTELMISSPVNITSNAAEFPNIMISNPRNQQLNGYGFYSFIGKKYYEFHLGGEKMELQLPGNNLASLDKFTADIFSDSTGYSIKVLFKQGTAESKSSAYYFRSNFVNGDILYYKPRGQMRSFNHDLLKARLNIKNLSFKYENFNIWQIQNWFKVRGKKKVKRNTKPLDLQIQFATIGNNNFVNTDFLKFNFEGEGYVYGTSSQMLAKAEINALSGEFGVVGQEYKIDELGIRWDDRALMEGTVGMSAVKWLAASCSTPDSRDKCSIEINLNGRFQSMEFSYGGSCVGELGESWNPAALLNSAGKDCYDPELKGDVSFAFIEGQLSHFSSRKIRKWSGEWIQQTNISGIDNFLSKENTGTQVTNEIKEPVTLEVETNEWKRLRLRAKSGYIPRSISNPWENEAALTWRPPFEKISNNPVWQDRVKKGVRVESLVKTGSSQQIIAGQDEQEKDINLQFGINYNYEFWNFW